MTRVEELHRAHRYASALDATNAIEDPAQRAEWEFQVLYDAGDLPGAFAAAKRGIDAAPEHLGLIQNALVCALTLGLGAESRRIVEQWESALTKAQLDPAARAASLERLERFRQEVAKLTDLDRAAERAISRARVLSLFTLAVTTGLLAWLALAPRPRAST